MYKSFECEALRNIVTLRSPAGVMNSAHEMALSFLLLIWPLSTNKSRSIVLWYVNVIFLNVLQIGGSMCGKVHINIFLIRITSSSFLEDFNLEMLFWSKNLLFECHLFGSQSKSSLLPFQSVWNGYIGNQISMR